jgi:hypothetical protein
MRRLSAVRSLAGLLESPRTDHRVSAVASLAALNAPACETSLLNALDDPERAVYTLASTALVSLAEGAIDSYVVEDLATWTLTAAHKDRYTVVLGQLSDPTARETLHGFLSSDDEPTRVAALSGLWHNARFSDGEPVHALFAESDSVAIKKKAILVLGRVGYRPACRDLIDLLSDPNPGLKGNAHWALRSITNLSLRQDVEMWELWWNIVGKR